MFNRTTVKNIGMYLHKQKECCNEDQTICQHFPSCRLCLPLWHSEELRVNSSFICLFFLPAPWINQRSEKEVLRKDMSRYQVHITWRNAIGLWELAVYKLTWSSAKRTTLQSVLRKQVLNGCDLSGLCGIKICFYGIAAYLCYIQAFCRLL